MEPTPQQENVVLETEVIAEESFEQVEGESPEVLQDEVLVPVQEVVSSPSVEETIPEVSVAVVGDQAKEVVFHNTPPELIQGIVDSPPFFYPNTDDIKIVNDGSTAPIVTLRLDQPFGYWLPNPIGEYGLALYESSNHH